MTCAWLIWSLVARKIGPRLTPCFVADFAEVEVESWAIAAVLKTQSSSRVSVRIFFIRFILCEARRSARLIVECEVYFRKRRYDTTAVNRSYRPNRTYNDVGKSLTLCYDPFRLQRKATHSRPETQQ